MSLPTNEIDYALWEAYLTECAFLGIKPSISDYMVFLQEADLDREENYDV